MTDIDSVCLSLEGYLHRLALAYEAKSHGWDENSLHISDLGQCPRAVMLRLSGAAIRPKGGEEQRKQDFLFFLANQLHEMHYAAWAEGGILVEKECSLRGFLPPGWTGRFDAIINYGGGLRIADVKTVVYLQKTGVYPQPKHMLQVIAYDMFVHEAFGLTLPPLIYYIQSNLMHDIPAIEVAVAHNESARELVVQRMAKLEHLRDALPELPPILPRTMQFSGRKTRGIYPKVIIGADPACNPKKCDYCLGDACQPDMEPEEVAQRSKNGEWNITSPDRAEEFAEWLEEQDLDEHTGDE